MSHRRQSHLEGRYDTACGPNAAFGFRPLRSAKVREDELQDEQPENSSGNTPREGQKMPISSALG
jgi:hypothetical protein